MAAYTVVDVAVVRHKVCTPRAWNDSPWRGGRAVVPYEARGRRNVLRHMLDRLCLRRIILCVGLSNGEPHKSPDRNGP
jgi:hypothetical protein